MGFSLIEPFPDHDHGTEHHGFRIIILVKDNEKNEKRDKGGQLSNSAGAAKPPGGLRQEVRLRRRFARLPVPA